MKFPNNIFSKIKKKAETATRTAVQKISPVVTDEVKKIAAVKVDDIRKNIGSIVKVAVIFGIGLCVVGSIGSSEEGVSGITNNIYNIRVTNNYYYAGKGSV